MEVIPDYSKSYQILEWEYRFRFLRNGIILLISQVLKNYKYESF